MKACKRLIAWLAVLTLCLTCVPALAQNEGTVTGGVDFDAANGATSHLQYGTMFYINWATGNGLSNQGSTQPGRDCSGDAANGANPDMVLSMTLTFEAIDGVSDPAACWKRIALRLRSSTVDGKEMASEFYNVHRSAYGDAAKVEVAVPLSAFDTGAINWADLKELIIQVPVEDAFYLGATGNSDKLRLTVENARIVNYANLAGRARLQQLLDETADYRYAADEAGAVFEQARQDAVELLKDFALDEEYVAAGDRLAAAVEALKDLRDTVERAAEVSGPSEAVAPRNGAVTLTLGCDADLSLHDPDALVLQVTGEGGEITGGQATVHGDISTTVPFEDWQVKDGVIRLPLGGSVYPVGFSVTLQTAQPFRLTDACIIDVTQQAEQISLLEEMTGNQPVLFAPTDAPADDYAATTAKAQALLARGGFAATEDLRAARVALLMSRHAWREISRGDVDDDMQITAADALMALQAATDKILLTTEESTMANVDSNGGVNAVDALQILQFTTDKINEFPRPEQADVPADRFADPAAANGSYQVLIGAPAADEEAAGFGGEGGYLAFQNVNFGAGGLKTFMAIVAVDPALSGQTLSARLDGVTADPVATVTLQATGGDTIFCEQYAVLTDAVSGVHDLYLTAPAGVRLDGFVFSSYTGEETAEEKTERMAWWNDARFGMFIHWGAYANFPFAPGQSGYTEWVMSTNKISRADYEQQAVTTFDPQNWDAEEIVKLAKDTGQKYIVFTSKHHEGFSMFNTHVKGFRDYSLMGYGVYQGADPLAQLAEASREAGIPLGCYYSIMDWRHPATSEDWGGMLDKPRYLSDMKAQLRELIQFYDLDILWFDGEWTGWWTTKDGQDLYRYLRTLKPSLIINNRVGKRAEIDGDFGTPEQTIPAGGLDYDWESCITMNGNWGYSPYDSRWKSPEWIVQSVVDTASKGGNILLNVGPDNQGVVPADCAANMRTAGQWFAVSGESIYGTSASPFTDALSFGAATKREGTLYLHVFKRPSDGRIVFPALKNELLGADVLGSGLRLNVEQGDNVWAVTLPATAVVQYDTVIRVEVEGMPQERNALVYSDNYALNKPTTVSNFYQNNEQYAGAAAVDGNSSTRWATDNNVKDCWLQVDLEAPTAFNCVKCSEYTATGGQRVTSYNVEYWDGSEWQVVYTGDSIGSLATAQFETVTAQKVRLHILTIAANAQGGPSIWEFGVYSVTAAE